MDVPLTSKGPIYDYLKLVRDQLRSEICMTFFCQLQHLTKLLFATEQLYSQQSNYIVITIYRGHVDIDWSGNHAWAHSTRLPEIWRLHVVHQPQQDRHNDAHGYVVSIRLVCEFWSFESQTLTARVGRLCNLSMLWSLRSVATWPCRRFPGQNFPGQLSYHRDVSPSRRLTSKQCDYRALARVGILRKVTPQMIMASADLFPEIMVGIQASHTNWLWPNPFFWERWLVVMLP